jgi:predicted deacylase
MFRRLAKPILPIRGWSKAQVRPLRIHVSMNNATSREAMVADWDCKVGDYVNEGATIGSVITSTEYFDIVTPESGVIVSRLEPPSSVQTNWPIFTVRIGDDVDDDEMIVEMSEP